VALDEAVPVALDELVPVALDEPVPVALDEPVPVALDEPVPVALDEPVPVALDEPVPVCELEGVWLEVMVFVGVTEGVPVLELERELVAVFVGVPEGVFPAVPLLEGVPVVVDEAELVMDGVGCRKRAEMLSTRRDELPAAALTLTMANFSVTEVAGGSTTERVTQPERPNEPTAVTLTAYSTVVVVPDASVAIAVTSAESLRVVVSRATK